MGRGHEAHITVYGEPVCLSELRGMMCGFDSLAEARRELPQVARALYVRETGRDAPHIRGHHAVRVVRGQCPEAAASVQRLREPVAVESETVNQVNETPITPTTECESCLQAGEHRPATTRSTNPRFSGYALCEECATHYDAEPTNEV